MDEGINPDNMCLYDISTLRFMFNGIVAMTNKFMNDYYHYDFQGLKSSLQMLQQVSDFLITEIKQQTMANSFREPIKASTPKKQGCYSVGGVFDNTQLTMPSRKF